MMMPPMIVRSSHRNIAGDCFDQLTDLGDGVAEESGIGLRSDGQFPANVANTSSFKREASPALSMSCHEREALMTTHG